MGWKTISNDLFKKECYNKIADKTCSVSMTKVDDKEYVCCGKVWFTHPLGFDKRIYDEMKIEETKKDADESYKKLKDKCDKILRK